MWIDVDRNASKCIFNMGLTLSRTMVEMVLVVRSKQQQQFNRIGYVGSDWFATKICHAMDLAGQS